MTNEQDEAVNPVDQVQQQLDQAQEGAIEEPSTVSRADLDTMKANFETQLRDMQTETRGLQSRLDKDRQEAERAERTRVAEAKVAEMRVNAQALEDPAQKALWDTQADLEQARINEARNAAPVAAETDPKREMERQLVRNFGVDPDNPAIDYAALSDGSIDVDARQKKFFDSLHAVKAPVAAAPAQPAQPASSVVTPPSNAAPSQQSGGFATFDDLNDAVIRGEVNSEQYAQERRQRGW